MKRPPRSVACKGRFVALMENIFEGRRDLRFGELGFLFEQCPVTLQSRH